MKVRSFSAWTGKRSASLNSGTTSVRLSSSSWPARPFTRGMPSYVDMPRARQGQTIWTNYTDLFGRQQRQTPHVEKIWLEARVVETIIPAPDLG